MSSVSEKGTFSFSLPTVPDPVKKFSADKIGVKNFLKNFFKIICVEGQE
jgi:hypothetical protein